MSGIPLGCVGCAERALERCRMLVRGRGPRMAVRGAGGSSTSKRCRILARGRRPRVMGRHAYQRSRQGSQTGWVSVRCMRFLASLRDAGALGGGSPGVVDPGLMSGIPLGCVGCAERALEMRRILARGRRPRDPGTPGDGTGRISTIPAGIADGLGVGRVHAVSCIPPGCGGSGGRVTRGRGPRANVWHPAGMRGMCGARRGGVPDIGAGSMPRMAVRGAG
jgi:hypothetical protein